MSNNITNIFSLLCRSSSIDRDTNSASILEIIEEITITSDPFVKSDGNRQNNFIPLPFELFTLWERGIVVNEETICKVKISIINPQKIEKEQITVPLKFESGKKRVRLRIKSPGINFSGYGTHSFRIYLEVGGKFVTVKEIPLEIKSNI